MRPLFKWPTGLLQAYSIYQIQKHDGSDADRMDDGDVAITYLLIHIRNVGDLWRRLGLADTKLSLDVVVEGPNVT